jgi:hypothetical protein
MMAFIPGLALTIVVYGINVFGDAMRDLLDPRLRGGGGSYSVRGKKGDRRNNHIRNLFSGGRGGGNPEPPPNHRGHREAHYFKKGNIKFIFRLRALFW